MCGIPVTIETRIRWRIYIVAKKKLVDWENLFGWLVGGSGKAIPVCN